MKEIQLSKDKVTLVDDEDYEFLNQWKWHLSTNGHAIRCATVGLREYKNIYMHRVILNTPDGLLTDHIDRNKLNNCKSNLRVCTSSQNVANTAVRKNNTSGFKGVHYGKDKKKWIATICVLYKIKKLGAFKTPEEAAIAYKKAAEKYFGEFMCIEGNLKRAYEGSDGNGKTE